jgi:hypothetical protein
MMNPTQIRAVPSRLLAVAALALIAGPAAHAGTFENDFSEDPFSPSLPANQRLTIFSNQAATSPNRPSWVPSGGVADSGYLKLTDAVGSIRSTIVFPDFEPGFHVAGFNFGVDCRLGGGGADPADGFSINFARASVIGGAVDPVIGTGEGYAGANNVGHTEDNRHEEGTRTGIGIGFDAYFSGGEDKIGISVRVDNSLLSQVELPLKNLPSDDPGYANSLQTGPTLPIPNPDTPQARAERVAGLGWERFEVKLDPATGRLDVLWKGVKVIDQLETNFVPGPGRLVFGARTGGQNQAHHFDNLSLQTFPVEIATVTRAGVSHAGFSFEITDFDSTSVVTPADIDYLSIDGFEVTPTSVTKNGNVTTVTYLPPTPFPPNTPITYRIDALDQNDEWVTAFGSLTTPILPQQFFIADAPLLNQWNIRELRGGTVGGTPVINSALAIAATPPQAPVNYTAPYFNLTDDNNFGSRGFFKRDTLFATNTATTDDNNIVALGRTKVLVTEAGDHTFWVQSDDGFALRVNGGSFTKVAGTAGALIDPSDPSTIAFLNGTGNSNTRGTVFLAAGEHVIDFLWFEGTGGAFCEVAWAAGDHATDTTGGRWTLVGGAGDTPYFPAGPLAEPVNVAGNWAVRNYYAGGDVPSLRAAFERIANPGGSLIANATHPVINFRDPNNGGADGLFNNNSPFPLEAAVSPAVDDNHFVTVARHEIEVTAAGDYTVAVTSDDGFALRILGGPYLINGGGPATIASGNDPLDPTAFLNSGANNVPTFGVYRVAAAGTYVVEVVQVEQTGGSSLEVAWAPGNFTSRNSTSAWQLLGNPDDPAVPPLIPVMPDTWFAGLPPAPANNWSLSFHYARQPGSGTTLVTVDSIQKINDVLANPGITPVLLESTQMNFFNRSPLTEPRDGAGLFRNYQSTTPANEAYRVPDLYFPGVALTAEIDDAVALATARIVIPTTGTYTFGVNSDDGFALRIVGAPNGFSRLSGTADAFIDMAQPNTFYRSGGTSSSRAVIDLTAGEYDIEFAFYERGGGAHFEVFTAPGDFTNEADSTAWRIIGAPGGLALVQQTVDPGDSPPAIGDFDFDASTGDFSFSWNSVEGALYQIEYSDDLATWYNLETDYEGEAGTTTYSGNVSELTGIENTKRVFFRLEDSN